jgi:glycopeptide antibiotics resistance protein
MLMYWFAQLYAKRLFYALGFIAMGVALEFIQGMTPYRTFEYFDMVANAAGVLLGWALANTTPKILPR